MTTQIDLLVAVPTAEPAPPLAPAAGPTARLVALPQPRGGLLSTSSGLDEHLAQLELARQAQLDSLPPTAHDPVAAAHRGTVARILEQVRAARRRVSDDQYGTCVCCTSSIHPERLELRPWLITCSDCASPPDMAQGGPRR